MTKNVIHAEVSSIGRTTWRDPELPIHVSGRALMIEQNPAPARGKQVSVEMSARTAQWAGAALVRYGWTPADVIGDFMIGDAFEKAFDRELKLGVERAVEAGTKAVAERRAMQAAAAERRRLDEACDCGESLGATGDHTRRLHERVTVIEDSTANGFDPTAYGDDPNSPCETCSHAGGYDHGMQFTMRGVCSDCVDCYPEDAE
jgi:hypothetical protein